MPSNHPYTNPKNNSQIDFVVDATPSTTMILAVSSDADAFAHATFRPRSQEYMGVWLLLGDVAKAVVDDLLDRGFRIKINGGLL
jgi:hypothetical protein